VLNVLALRATEEIVNELVSASIFTEIFFQLAIWIKLSRNLGEPEPTLRISLVLCYLGINRLVLVLKLIFSFLLFFFNIESILKHKY
jgi:hypothetical protein